jgi:hypothetical protein
MSKGSAAASRVDMSRYDAQAPEGVLENDIQAWKKALSNVKSQFENQSNRLLNLELAEAHGANVWLHHNNALEGQSYAISQRSLYIYTYYKLMICVFLHAHSFFRSRASLFKADREIEDTYRGGKFIPQDQPRGYTPDPVEAKLQER